MSSKLKERGGGGAKITASKPCKALAESTPKEKGSAVRRTPIAAGKENPRNLYGGKISASRPRLVPKLVEKPAAAVTAVRWSTSSLLQGKDPIPSDFPRLMSDVRGDQRVSMVSGSGRRGRALGKDLEAGAGGRRSVGGIRVLEKCQQRKDVKSVSGVRVLENRRSSGVSGLQVVKNNSKVSHRNSGKASSIAANRATDSGVCTKKDALDSELNPVDEKGINDVRITKDQKDGSHLVALKQSKKNENKSGSLELCKDKVVLATSPESMNERPLGGVQNLDGPKDRSSLSYNAKALGGTGKDDCSDVMVNHKNKDYLVLDIEKGERNGSVSLDRKVDVMEKSSDSIRVFEKIVGDMKGVHVISKYPSKLHERLALLEGRVQKIASEIKRTKEMLDVNNPDESKLILSDIQDKISGIEKAMGHAMDQTEGHLGPSEIIKVDSLKNKNAVTGQSGKFVDPKHSAKGLKHEELEARFFPHHKLLGSQRSSGASGEQISNFLKNNGDREQQEWSLSPVDENPVASELLASVNTEQSSLDKERIMLAAVQRMRMEGTSVPKCASKKAIGNYQEEIEHPVIEKLEVFDDQENKPAMMVHVETEEACRDQLCEIGHKPSTAGWFVSEGEAVLLAHDDGSCSYYDIANYEVKAEYKPPAGVSNNLWGDCWLIRASGADGCSGRYVVAASAGNTLDSGFCSWDFYTRDVKAFRVEDETPNSFATSSSRRILGPLSNIGLFRRSAPCAMPSVDRQHWWYRPCGPLLISCASRQKTVSAYDIRDGDLVMKWEANNPVMGMEYSSPLQWRSRGKVIIAGTDAISLWDVNSLSPYPLLSVASAGKKVYSLHISSTDAELGGGVRQRVSSSEVEGNDGVFCTQESVNAFDFRLPTGIGLKICRHGAIGHSIFSHGDSIFIGSTEGRSPIKGGPRSWVQRYSLRMGKIVATYDLPEFNSHIHHASVTQVWGNTNLVMGICGMGLFVFDAYEDEGSQAFNMDQGNIRVKETIGPQDLYCPTFDYLGSRALVISRDRPAFWRYLL
ncbi:KIN14B-interacting protein At4g14310 isoform X1 [Elaeis guineensis]|uniref:KIN14B-interacting protein At4g14310 isoform X1 n=1 Tax=Elaeis guineensis var. tenera TaxID=51953 RepID=A0A6I9S0X2_ELAGV|nr:KIN14B-interacting protein At4g14310 isoform X1 [Elaeis guineensis]